MHKRLVVLFFIASLNAAYADIDVEPDNISKGVQRGAATIVSPSSNALAVGPAGATNPSFQVDASTASAVNGLKLKTSAAGSGIALSVISSATNEGLSLSTKGNGQYSLASQNFNLTSNRLTTNFSGAGGGGPFWQFSYGGNTGTSAGTNDPIAIFAFNSTKTWATGSVALQQNILIQPTTLAAVGASTFTNVSTFSTSAPICGSNTTCTAAAGLYIPTEALTNTTNGYGINIAAPSGATNNYAANFAGDITLTGAAPAVTLCGGGSLVSGSSDHKGQITGVTTATACTITFAASLGTTPSCHFMGSAALVAPLIASISTSAVTLNMTSYSGTLYYMCF